MFAHSPDAGLAFQMMGNWLFPSWQARRPAECFRGGIRGADDDFARWACGERLTWATYLRAGPCARIQRLSSPPA